MLEVPLYQLFLQYQTPDTHLSTRFHCIDEIIGRITPFQSLYLLDFVWPDGTRVTRTPNFSVWDVAEDGHHVELPPVGSTIQKGDTVQMYYINSVRTYEIRRRDGYVIKKIQFPPTLQVIWHTGYVLVNENVLLSLINWFHGVMCLEVDVEAMFNKRFGTGRSRITGPCISRWMGKQ